MMLMKEMLNLTPEGHAARLGWPEMACASHAQTAACDAAGGWRENLICG